MGVLALALVTSDEVSRSVRRYCYRAHSDSISKAASKVLSLVDF